MSGDPLATYFDCLFAAEPPGAFLEVRWRLPDRSGMGQLWSPVEHRGTAIDSIRSIGAGTDCYVGCAPRNRRYGGRDAVDRAHVLWADCDSPESLAALERFEPRRAWSSSPALAATPTGHSSDRSTRSRPRSETARSRARSAPTSAPATPRASCTCYP